jgi:hypothetical protein
MSRPFRWDVTRREQLGSLVTGEARRFDATFLNELRDCCARVLPLAGDSRLVFVGRSPESLYDYLSGLLADTERSDRCSLLNISIRQSAERVMRERPATLAAMRGYLTGLGLSPERIAAGSRTVALVDLVWKGETFGNLSSLLLRWSAEIGVDPAAVRRRLRFVGITVRSRNSPNTWRWYQQVAWARSFPRSAMCSVSVPYGLWTYLGDWQHKVSRSHPPVEWDAEPSVPPRDADRVEAVRFAFDLHQQGRRDDERRRFAALLAARPEMSQAWLRRLIPQLRGLHPSASR